jgi:hypothetical protein
MGKFHLSDKYFRMGSEYNIMSPNNKKWHFYGHFIHKSQRIKKDHFKFLVFTQLETKIIAAHKFSMTPYIIEIPQYLNEDKYLEFKTKIAEKRTRKPRNDFYLLYNGQKSKCEFCNRHIKYESIKKETKLRSLVIHPIKPLNINGAHIGYNYKSLLHKSCHKQMDQILKKKQIMALPFKKL